MSHPGDWKKQGVVLTAVWAPLPQPCSEDVLRHVRVRFQLQTPRDHSRWVTIGGRLSHAGYVAPMLIGSDARALERVRQREREEEGRSCWETTANGTRRYTCSVDLQVENPGGKAMAEPPNTQNPTIRLPRDERYRCTPGPGITHVRTEILSRVSDVTTNKLLGKAVSRVPVKVRKISLPANLLGHRGQLPGPC